MLVSDSSFPKQSSPWKYRKDHLRSAKEPSQRQDRRTTASAFQSAIAARARHTPWARRIATAALSPTVRATVTARTSSLPRRCTMMGSGRTVGSTAARYLGEYA